MFLKVHAIFHNERILLNVDEIISVQEMKEGSKYYEAYGTSGAKSVIRINDRVLPVKETVVQIEHLIGKNMPILGGK